MASFEVWDDLVRQAVCWLASLQTAGQVPTGELPTGEIYPRLVDPMQAVTEAVQADPARSQQGRLLSAWATEIGTGHARETTVTTRQLEQIHPAMRTTVATADGADRPETLYEVLKSLAGTPGGISTRSLGKLLSRFKDRVYAGYCLRAGAMRQGVATWRLEDLGGFGGSDPTTSMEKSMPEISTGTSENKTTKPTKPTAARRARKARGANGTAAARAPSGGAVRRGLRAGKC